MLSTPAERSRLLPLIAAVVALAFAGSVFGQPHFLPTGESVKNTGDPRVAVDSQGGLHLVYPVVADMGAVYAYCPAGCEGEEDVVSVDFPTHELGAVQTALVAVDGADRPHLLFSTRDAVVYATCEAGCGEADGWRHAVIHADDHDWELTGDAFALDPEGKPRFLMHAYQAYLGIGAPDPGTRFFACDADCLDAANWTYGQVSEQSWLEPTLRYDAAGAAHVATIIPVDDVELAAYFRCDGDCGNEQVDNWPGIGLGEAYSDRYVAEIAPAVSLALTAAGGVRIAFLGSDAGDHFLAYLECEAECTAADDADGWEALILLHSASGSDLGDGLALGLDSSDQPRLAYTTSGSILLAYCDGDCVGRSGSDDWALTSVELANDIPADDIFLYYNCTVGHWFLRQPALALRPDGLPVVAYRAEDVSGGWENPDPTKPSCPVGVDMTMTRLAVLGGY